MPYHQRDSSSAARRANAMPSCMVCGQPALYLDLRLGGMACATHAAADVQIATLRSLTATLLKAIQSEGAIDREKHREIGLIIDRLRLFLKD